jgi:predicted AlkP superfamily pyrophosphatase or phosphodiesterase
MMNRNRKKRITNFLVLLLILATCVVVPASPPAIPRAADKDGLILVAIVDGLRPDSINPEDTPTLFRLRTDGAFYVNSHSVFPTVTRVNAAALATGTYPDSNGLVSNSMYVSAVDPSAPFNTGDYRQLIKLRETSGGRLLFAKSIGERLHERGIRFAVVSSGSTGSAFLLNHNAPQGVGLLVNGNLDPGKRLAWPDKTNSEILSRFGAAPREERNLLDWTERVLREYILSGQRPQVVFDWMTEPDGAQHEHGVGSKPAVEALRNVDRNIGLALQKLGEPGQEARTDVIVLSDHGFAWNSHRIDVRQKLIDAGIKAGPQSDDVVVASNGQSVLLHVKERDNKTISKIVRYLQAQSWVDVVFTAAGHPSRADRNQRALQNDARGHVPGTFSLELIRLANRDRRPDVVFTLPWGSSPNAFGVKGTHYYDGRGPAGPTDGPASGHGGLGAWTVRNTMILSGPSFKRGVTIRTAAANVDIAPTILHLKGIEASGMDGRILREALRDGPDEEQLPFETRVLTNEIGEYRIALQFTEVDGRRYIDKAWRIR